VLTTRCRGADVRAGGPVEQIAGNSAA
jgi:hypothetical protein